MREKKVKEAIKKLIKSGGVSGVVGLKSINSQVHPYFFQKEEELERFALSPRYPVSIICRQIQNAHTDSKIGVVARGCDERAVIELAKKNQIDMKRLKVIGVACTKDEAVECGCELPYPKEYVAGEKTIGVSLEKNPKIQKMMRMSLDKRLAFWESQFLKCIKCYGCRNICPVCMCDECCLEERLWIAPGEVPPQYPLFHLIRAFHISDKCIGCGECEATCPADIPLTSIYTAMRKELKHLFDYAAGVDIERDSPVITNLEKDEIKEERKK